jgi:hypothetical protein
VSVTVQVILTGTWLAVEQVLDMMVKSAAFAPERLGLLVKVSGTVPVFVSVTTTGPLPGLGKSRKEPNGTLAGKVTGGMPVPTSDTLCVLGEALSAKLSEAFSAAPVEGVNVRVTTQLIPAATGVEVEQVVDPATIAKSAALVPVMPGLLEKVREPVPVFVRVTIMEALVVPCGT